MTPEADINGLMLLKGKDPSFEAPVEFESTRRQFDMDPGMRWTWLLWAGVSFLASVTVFLLTWNNVHLSDRFVWNTFMAGTDVGGMTISEARDVLLVKVEDFQKQELILSTNHGAFKALHASIAPNFQINSALSAAFAFGHTDHPGKNFYHRLRSMFKTSSIELNSTFDENQLFHVIRTHIPPLSAKGPRDAEVRLVGKEFIVMPGEAGLSFDYSQASKVYRSMLESFENDTMHLDIKEVQPDIDVPMAKKAQRMANHLVRRYLTPIYSYDGYNYDRWTIELWTRRSWVEFKKVSEDGNYFLYAVLRSDKLRHDLNTRIAPYMYRAKEDITILSANGRPVVAGVAKDGYYLDVPKTIKRINRAIMRNELDTSGHYAVPLEVAHLKGGVANPDNEFGISEVLATGVTDFFGSPENRKFNINHGARNFHNVFLKPKEKFSFIQYMGKVDSTTGYAKELVIINGDSLEPQYGGGMCQISSTLFRTVFFSGLKVLKRSNHSFEVKYYLPAGLDATVYDPAPDLVFQNDTENPVLIQNLVDLNRTKMYFKIYGKSDGRILRFSGPNMDGPVGEKEEHYQVSWYRDIEFPDGKKKREKFVSVYRNKDLVKKYQPENLLMQQDSVFVPVSVDSNSFSSPLPDSTKL